MIKDSFHIKIALFLNLFILSNYFFLSINFSEFTLKINFIVFLLILTLFYFKNILENIYLKIFFLVIVFISLGTPLSGWDSRSIWLFHAKRIFYDNSIFSVADNYADFSHNGYPALASAFASSLAVLVGYWNEVFPKIAFSMIFLPPLIITYAFIKKSSYIIFLSIVLFIIGKFLFNGLVDGLVAVYFCLSALLMYQLIILNNQSYKKILSFNLVSFCFFTSLTLIKNEGIALLFILFITAFLIKIYKKELGNDFFKLTLMSLSFLPIILWKYFCYSEGIGNDYINNDTLQNLSYRINDLESYKLIFYFLILNEKFLVSLLFFFLCFWINWDRNLFYYISIIVILYIFVLFFIYLSTPFDLYFQLNSTAARVIKSLSFLTAFFALYNLDLKIRES